MAGMADLLVGKYWIAIGILRDAVEAEKVSSHRSVSSLHIPLTASTASVTAGVGAFAEGSACVGEWLLSGKQVYDEKRKEL